MCPLYAWGHLYEAWGRLNFKEQKRDRIYEEFASRGFDNVDAIDCEILKCFNAATKAGYSWHKYIYLI